MHFYKSQDRFNEIHEQAYFVRERRQIVHEKIGKSETRGKK